MPRCLREAPDRVQVKLDYLLPVGIAKVFGPLPPDDAGVVDQDIQRPQGRLGLGDGSSRRFRLHQIGLHQVKAPSSGLHGLPGLRCIGGMGHDRHIGPGLGQPDGDGLADAHGPASDQRDPAFQRKHLHLQPPHTMPTVFCTQARSGSKRTPCRRPSPARNHR